MLIHYDEIFLGNRCNNKCLYCFQKEKNTPDLHSIVDMLEHSKNDSVVFYGGEPTLRSDLIQIFYAARKNGYRRIKIITNGRAFSDIEFLFEIIKAGCSLFEIKLWGSNPNIHDYITQQPDSFWQTLQGLENLQRIDCDKFICVRIPICRQNYQDIEKTVTMILNFGIHRIILFFVDNQLSFNRALPYLRSAINISILNRVWILTEGLPFCVMHGLEHHIGEIYSRNNITQKVYKHHKHCKKCIYKQICPGVEVEYLKQFGDKEFFPIKESRYFQDIKALYE